LGQGRASSPSALHISHVTYRSYPAPPHRLGGHILNRYAQWSVNIPNCRNGTRYGRKISAASNTSVSLAILRRTEIQPPPAIGLLQITCLVKGILTFISVCSICPPIFRYAACNLGGEGFGETAGSGFPDQHVRASLYGS
jgi:hypothetical protein